MSTQQINDYVDKEIDINIRRFKSMIGCNHKWEFDDTACVTAYSCTKCGFYTSGLHTVNKMIADSLKKEGKK